MLVLAIVLMQSLRCNPMVAREEVVGRVIRVEARDLRPMGAAEPNCRVLVALPDSAQIRLFLPPPVPRPGDLVLLHAERFERGNTEYFLAGDRWRTEGPLPVGQVNEVR